MPHISRAHCLVDWLAEGSNQAVLHRAPDVSSRGSYYSYQERNFLSNRGHNLHLDIPKGELKV